MADDDDQQLSQRLPEDNDSPATPATPNPNDPADQIMERRIGSNLDDTHPVTDTNIQAEEAYDEGTAGAAEASDPNTGDAVEDFDPEK